MMKDKVLMVMAEALRAEVDETISSENMLTWDSLAHMRLIVGLEDEFGIEIEDQYIETLNSFDAIYSYLRSHVHA